MTSSTRSHDRPSTTRKHRRRVLAVAWFAIWVVVTGASCSTQINIPGNVHLSCSPEVHLVAHAVICEEQPPGDWPYKCEVSGVVKNAGPGKATHVLIRVEFGKEWRDMRSFTFNPLGDLNAGATADFRNEFTYIADPGPYDVWVECTGYDVPAISSSSTKVPTSTAVSHAAPPSSLSPSAQSAATIEPSPASTSTPAATPEVHTSDVLESIPPDIWKSNGPYGGAIFTLAIDPVTPTTLYAGTFGGGIFKTTTGGMHWTAVNTGLTNPEVSAMAIDPNTPDTIYAGTLAWPGGMFKSTNGGESWTAVNNGFSGGRVSALAIDPSTPTTLYADTEQSGVFKSTDGGESRVATNSGMPEASALCLVIDPKRQPHSMQDPGPMACSRASIVARLGARPAQA